MILKIKILPIYKFITHFPFYKMLSNSTLISSYFFLAKLHLASQTPSSYLRLQKFHLAYTFPTYFEQLIRISNKIIK